MGYVTNTYVNKTQFETKPIRTLNDMIFYEQLNTVEHIRKEVQLNYNPPDLYEIKKISDMRLSGVLTKFAFFTKIRIQIYLWIEFD